MRGGEDRGRAGATSLKERLEEAKEEYTETDGEFHRTSIAIERRANQVKKNEEEAARKGSIAGALEKEKQIKQEKAAEAERDFKLSADKAARLEEGYGLLRQECSRAIARYEEMKTRLGDLHMERTAMQEGLKTLEAEVERTRAKKEGVEKERLVLQEKKDAIRERLGRTTGWKRWKVFPWSMCRTKG